MKGYDDMNEMFSEAARLLIQNWDIVKEIHLAEENLGTALSRYLRDFKSKLTHCSWWNNEWCFKLVGNSQIYISRNAWERENDHAIWIGVEDFTAESIFGTGSIGQMYVWVSGNRPELIAALRRRMADEKDVIGELHDYADAYVITCPLRKCLPEMLDQFDDVIAAPMVAFFSCYAKKADMFQSVLNEF